jgi:hypothetical protein
VAITDLAGPCQVARGARLSHGRHAPASHGGAATAGSIGEGMRRDGVTRMRRAGEMMWRRLTGAPGQCGGIDSDQCDNVRGVWPDEVVVGDGEGLLQLSGGSIL